MRHVRLWEKWEKREVKDRTEIYAKLRAAIMVMSIQACRDARCNGTLSLPDPRIVSRVLEYKQVQRAPKLQLLFS
jgi:hypothetical protein